MKLIRNLFTLSLVFSFLAPIQAQKLSRSERKIIERVSANNDEAIDFLERVVNINSGSLNIEGVKKVGEVFSEGFEAIGFNTEWESMPEEMNRAGHLIAKTMGSQG